MADTHTPPPADTAERSGPWSEHLRLGTVAGIPIGINWSVLIIAWLIGAGLANHTLPQLYPGYRQGEYAVMAMLAVVAFLGSILGHELAHATVAQRYGVTVESITLWLIGGVAVFASEPPNPRADIHIAAVGPGASILIGLAWFGVGGVLAEIDAPEIVLGTALWLGTINLVLAGFNLIPAFPLDGGRVMRGALWGWRGDRVWATRRAALGGRFFAVALVVIGALFAADGLFVNAAWLWLIAWFVAGASIAEVRHTVTSSAFADRTAGDIMSPEPVCIDGSLSVAEALNDVVLRHRWSSYPVVDRAGRVTGLLTLDRIRRVAPAARTDTLVSAAAHRLEDVVVVSPDTPAVGAIEQMERTGPQRIVVAEHDMPVGIISVTDVVRGLDIARLVRHD